jgi:hypothetical protein
VGRGHSGEGRRVGRQLIDGRCARRAGGSAGGNGEPVEAGRRVQGEEPGLRAGHDEGVRELARQERDRTGTGGPGLAADLDA